MQAPHSRMAVNDGWIIARESRQILGHGPHRDMQAAVYTADCYFEGLAYIQ